MRCLAMVPIWMLCIVPMQDHPPRSSFIDLATAAEELMHTHFFDPQRLTSANMQSTLQAIQNSALQTGKVEDFMARFNHLWRQAGISHIQLVPAQQSATSLAKQLDQMTLGGNGAALTYVDQVAVLKVTSMMGQDTIEIIKQAYHNIHESKPSALIIDLRNNVGGAFAIKPLVGFLLDEPLDIGVFASQKWYAKSRRDPQYEDYGKLKPWQGWSIISFWNDVTNQPLTRIQLKPQSPRHTGTVYVLINGKTASAAEMAAAALGQLNQVTLIGEKTAGNMLSQRPFDVGEGFHLFVPIADYFAKEQGRIEGHGIHPDVLSEDAMKKALELAKP